MQLQENSKMNLQTACKTHLSWITASGNKQAAMTVQKHKTDPSAYYWHFFAAFSCIQFLKLELKLKRSAWQGHPCRR